MVRTEGHEDKYLVLKRCTVCNGKATLVYWYGDDICGSCHGRGGHPLPNPDEPVFVLRGQDKLALDALEAYHQSILQNGDMFKEFARHVEEHIEEFEAWPHKKMPD